ncbi:PREDICTED: protein CHUP1, chloroplastic [Tarenaya hassleriana]|uniref:protein CHUP1, chloroplastic n=1 Tax=Tarenaya hassleriana TaxID=28532 RepID=UPI00053C1D00|nr:PREDICTED: protein CHUP1, chloroplastic [Tarenaya hassleriana]
MDKKDKDHTSKSHPIPLAAYSMKEEGIKMLPNHDDDSDLMRMVKEFQGSLVRIDLLEKENQELKQEVARLRGQVTHLKAHDNERKSMLWKKLQSSYDCGNTDGSNLKALENVKLNEKGQEAKNPSPKTSIQESSPVIKPPPPPPLPSKTTLGKRSVRRAPEVVELYRALTRRESHMENRMSQKGKLSPAFSRNMIGEIENRSKYLSAIKSDIERHKEHIQFLISKVETTTYTDISEVETFVKWLDEELSSLVDERAVLKNFPKWPERKADALREAAFKYRGLRNLESEILSFKDNPKEHLTQALQRIQSLQDRLEESVSSTERMKEGTGKRYRDFQIPCEWMLDTGLIGQLKYSSLRLAQEYMKRITKELESNESAREGNLMLQGVRFAYTVHQFASGFDGETLFVFNELKKIITSEPRT